MVIIITNKLLFLVKSNKWSIIKAAFWLVELLLGYIIIMLLSH